MALARIQEAIASDDLSTLDDPMIATARRIIGLAKAGPAAQYVMSDYSGARSIIFGLHTDVIDEMASVFGGLCAGIIDGRTSRAARQQILDAFTAGTSGPLLLIHMASGSEGLNIQAASRVYLPEPSWVPATNEQAIARAYRRGQTSDVHATYMYLPGTLDETVCAALARKSSARDARRARMAQ